MNMVGADSARRRAPNSNTSTIPLVPLLRTTEMSTTCGISTGVLRCLDIGTRHNNVHEQLVQERHLWNLHGCVCAVWPSAPDTTTCMNNLSMNGTCGISTGVMRCLAIGTRHNNVHEQLVQERYLWNLHGGSALSGHPHQTQQRA